MDETTQKDLGLEDLWTRLKPITEGATPKEIGKLFFALGYNSGISEGMKLLDRAISRRGPGAFKRTDIRLDEAEATRDSVSSDAARVI